MAHYSMKGGEWLIVRVGINGCVKRGIVKTSRVGGDDSIS